MYAVHKQQWISICLSNDVLMINVPSSGPKIGRNGGMKGVYAMKVASIGQKMPHRGWWATVTFEKVVCTQRVFVLKELISILSTLKLTSSTPQHMEECWDPIYTVAYLRFTDVVAGRLHSPLQSGKVWTTVILRSSIKTLTDYSVGL